VDWKWILTATLPVVTLILGSVLTQWNDTKRETALLRREQRLHDLTREQARIDRREAFELTQLNEVHTVLSEMFSQALLCRDAVEAQEPFVDSGRLLSEANRKYSGMRGFILVDAVRHLADEAHKDINRMSMGAPMLGMNQESVQRASHRLTLAQEAIATRVREIYRDPASP